MKNPITNSEIISLNNLNVTVSALSHVDCLDTVTVQTRLSGKRMICRSGSAYFTMEPELTNAWSFGAHLLTLLGFFSMWLNSMLEIILSLRIKYDNSRNRNNFVMRKILIMSFYSIKNHNFYL